MYWDGAWDIALPFTVSIWVKPETGMATDTGIWNTTTSTSLNNIYNIDCNSVGGTAVSFGCASRTTAWAQAISTETHAFDTWHHVCARYISSTMRNITVDGTDYAENTTSNSPAAGRSQFNIGVLRRNTLVEYFKGRLAHLVVYNGALDDNEIVMLSQGISPLSINIPLLFYSPTLGRDTNDIDTVGAKTFTNVNATNDPDEPRIIVSKNRRFFIPQTYGGSAIELHGDAYLEPSTPSAPVTAVPCTMSIWVRNPSDGSSPPLNDKILMNLHDKDQALGYNQCMQMEYTGSGNVTYGLGRPFAFYRGSSGASAYATASIPQDGKFHNVCAVFETAALRHCYMDGANKGSEATSKTAPTLIDNLRIGRYGPNSRWPNADNCTAELTNATIWNVALTDAEVAMVGSGINPLTIRPTAIVFHSPLNGRGPTEQDIVGSLTLVKRDVFSVDAQSPINLRKKIKTWYSTSVIATLYNRFFIFMS